MIKGYKYICWDFSERNAEVYMSAVNNELPLHYSQLEDLRGYADREELPGIYFCKSLDELHVWLQDVFESNPSAIEILEVTALDEVRERVYDDGRIAYIASSCTCKVVPDAELTPDILRLLEQHFDYTPGV